MTETRKLRSILFADIEGYTALMQQNESIALDKLNSFKEILETTVSEYGGNVDQYFGDGCVITFQSSSQSVKCSMNLQKRFIEKNIPVRMGLHLGEVVFTNNNVFGDGVNIASRIESIGIPGSILISKTLRDQIKNKEFFKLHSLGLIQFKNVEEKIEVFAITNDGFRIPDPSNISGKIVSKKSNNKWIILASIVAASIGIGVWKIWLQPNQGQTSSVETKVLDKRIAIMVFENQTSDPELDAFGNMISDWITQRLMETDGAKVINVANLSEGNDLSTQGNPKLEALGIDLVLKGRYYEVDNQLMIQSNIYNIKDGNVIHAVDNIQGPRSAKLSLLHDLSEEVLGYWMVKEQTRYAQDPPRYEAYRNYKQALALTVSAPDEAEKKLRRAFQLDTNFYTPLLALHSFLGKEGKTHLQDSIFNILSDRSNGFTKLEKLKFGALKAIRKRDWLQVGEYSKQRLTLDPTDFEALNSGVIAFNYGNYPRRSLDMLNNFNPNYLMESDYDISWFEVNKMFPNFQLNNFKEIDQIATSYNQPIIPDALAAIHLKALIHMDSTDRLKRFFEYYNKKGVVNTSGSATPFFMIIYFVCDELLITGKDETLKIYVNKLKSIIENNPNHPKLNNILGYVKYYTQEYKAAAENWEKDQVQKKNWPPWLWKTLEVDRASRIGASYAMAGNIVKAKEKIESMQNAEGEPENLDGTILYHQARIYAAFGEIDHAIDLLESAIDKAYHFYGPVRFNNDPFLKPLFNEQRYKLLTSPNI